MSYRLGQRASRMTVATKAPVHLRVFFRELPRHPGVMLNLIIIDIIDIIDKIGKLVGSKIETQLLSMNFVRFSSKISDNLSCQL